MGLLFELVAFVMAGLVTVSIAKSVVDLLRREPKVKEKVVFIVDDVADLDEYELTNFVEFLRVVMVKDGRVLFVKRLDDSSKEGFENYMDILKFFSFEQSGIDLNRVLFRGAKDYFDVDLRERLFLMDSAEKEEFKRILEANGYKVEDLNLIYTASTGNVCLALYMIEMGFSVKELKEMVRGERYYTFSEIERSRGEERRRMIESNKALRFNGIFEIYKRLSKNPCYIALLVNHVAEDELEMFCEDSMILERFGGCRVVSFRDEYYWILESYEEDYPEKRRKVYKIRDDWRKFSHFVEALCDHHVYGRDVEGDLKVVREVLTEIYDKELEKSGEITYRMFWFGLRNVEWLFERGILKPKSAFIWGRMALWELPIRGIEFLRVVLKTWDEKWDEIVKDKDKLLHALSFASDLAEVGKRLFGKKEYYEIMKVIEGFLDGIDENDVILCLKVWTYSSLAVGLVERGYEGYGKRCLNKAEKTLGRIKELRGLAEVKFLIAKAQIGRLFGRDVIQILERCLDILEGLKFEDHMVDLFKPLGGVAKKKFERLLDVWKMIINYELGCAYIDIDLDEARRYFEKSLKFSKRFQDKLTVLSFIGRIEIIKGYRFEFEVGGERYNFERLWEMCKDNIYRVNNESVACICAEYLISSILLRRFDEEILGYLDYNNTAKTLFYGLSWILGCKLKDFDDLIKILRDYDIMIFPHVDDVKEQVLIEEAKIEVEEMYNSLLNKKKEYEAYKKLVWNKTYSLFQAFIRIIFFYVTGDLKTAKALAVEKSKVYPKIPSELFKELASAIDEEMKAKSDCEKEEAQEKVKKPFVKLFYFTV